MPIGLVVAFILHGFSRPLSLYDRILGGARGLGRIRVSVAVGVSGLSAGLNYRSKSFSVRSEYTNNAYFLNSPAVGRFHYKLKTVESGGFPFVPLMSQQAKNKSPKRVGLLQRQVGAHAVVGVPNAHHALDKASASLELGHHRRFFRIIFILDLAD